MGGHINRAQLCLYFSCWGKKHWSRPSGHSKSRCQVEWDPRPGTGSPQVLHLRQGPDARPSEQNHLLRKSCADPPEVPPPEKLPGWPRHFYQPALRTQLNPQGICSSHDTGQSPPLYYTITKMHIKNTVLLQELRLNISLIFLWSPKSDWPHSLFGCSCTGERFIPSTPRLTSTWCFPFFSRHVSGLP